MTIANEEHVEALLENVHGLVAMLHEVYAVAIDRGGQTEEEAQAILNRARTVLADHGVEV